MLPAAASLQKQGANKGATTAFLISTPESGVDSIAVTYALLDPIMTVVRPIAASVSAIVAGFLENFLNWDNQQPSPKPVAPPMAKAAGATVAAEHKEHVAAADRVPFLNKLSAGIRYAVTDVWGDIALWFYVGLAIAAVITVMIPDALMVNFLGGGLGSMLIMLVIGIPLYICATASTPVAAALILKGVSPGAALVFLLVGPATNVTSMSVLFKILGKKSTLRYLGVLAGSAVVFGLIVDQIYLRAGISPQAVIGEAAEIIPVPIKLAAVFILLAISIKPLYTWGRKVFSKKESGTHFVAQFPAAGGNEGKDDNATSHQSCGCGCGNTGGVK
nr:SO_0444 family Cu/Zn efflux transporter [Desulfosediminicola ganghwensis]